MANELRLNLGNFSFTKGTASASAPGQSLGVTVSGTHFIGNSQSIGTGDETLALGDVATNGYVFFKNTDPTNFIIIGADGSSYPIKLKPGEFAVMRWNGAAIHAKADTATCILQYTIIES